MTTRVLVIEDDPGVAGGIIRGLTALGFEVDLATDGLSGLQIAARGAHDIVVLDLMLPERTGIDVLRDLEGRRRAPVIVLTARTELADRLQCFALGAVDFMPKPFFLEELAARIRSRLSAREEAPRRVVRFADVIVDLDARVVTVGGAPAPLTRHELDVLAYLVERPGRAVAREQIAERGLSSPDPCDARTIDTHVARLRKKLGAEGARAVVTAWGVGYRFDPGAIPG